jgi:uncharacterized membrane protein YjgN (DUF898 family)
MRKSEGHMNEPADKAAWAWKPPSAFSFHGSWTDFAKIALPNVLLTVVTLGIYRFWATTRERQYLWSQTRFIDEPLEWTGRGIELFWGFIMVFFLVGVPFAILQLAAQGLIFQGETVLVAIITVVMFVLIFYLSGIAYFRALRYRLSRTYWRGIRGGSNNPGFQYGLSYIWKNIAGAIPIYLLYPWAQMSLWNERWSHMSFGPYRFTSNAQWTQLMKRYMLFYLIPFLLVVGAVIAGISAAASGGGDPNPIAAAGAIFGGVIVFVAVLGIYVALPIAALMYYSKFFRVAVAGLKLGELEFEFKARSPDWILYWLANIAIMSLAYSVAIIPVILFVAVNPTNMMNQIEAGESVIGVGLILAAVFAIIPLAFAAAIIQYRSWKFFVVHMEAFGEVNLDQMTQSETHVSAHGEGLLDAFDMGAI